MEPIVSTADLAQRVQDSLTTDPPKNARVVRVVVLPPSGNDEVGDILSIEVTLGDPPAEGQAWDREMKRVIRERVLAAVTGHPQAENRPVSVLLAEEHPDFGDDG